MVLSAKEKILQTARQMIEDYGYNNLNVNHLAEKAGVAIGTLYWHFKKGKVSLVKELASQEAQNIKALLTEVKINSSKPLEGFKPLILKYIEHHRKNKAFLRGLEIETMNNLESAEEFDNIKNAEFEGPTVFIECLFEKANIKTEGLSDKIRISTLLLDDLVHRHVLFDNRYGKDESFTNLLIKLFTAILG